MKIVVFGSNFIVCVNCKLVPKGHINMSRIILGGVRRQSIIWYNAGLVYQRIYASLGIRPQWVKLTVYYQGPFIMIFCFLTIRQGYVITYHKYLFDIFAHSYQNWNGAVAKPPFKLRHGWVITYYSCTQMTLLMHTINTMLIQRREAPPLQMGVTHRQLQVWSRDAKGQGFPLHSWVYYTFLWYRLINLVTIFDIFD